MTETASADIGAESGGSSTTAAAEALRILEEAEERLREGDFAGFGEALERLRRALRDMNSGETPSG